MMEIPVYLITGFLESGKTAFLKDVLASPDFADGTRSLLMVCEQGVEEYDANELAHGNIDVVYVENEEDLTREYMEQLQKRYRPLRVFVEYNGMWDPAHLMGENLPRRWEVVQTIALVDGSTFDMFLTNMRSMLSNIFLNAELVIFNRCSLDMDLQKYRRAIKAVNNQAMLSFEDEEGNQLELGKEQPPYDLNAETIRIEDEDYGLWFLDVSDSPERYRDKKVSFRAKVMIPPRFTAGCFVPGRNAMTCCANDIRFIGYVCKYKELSRLKNKQWVNVTAKIRYEYHPEYRAEGPVLYAQEVVPTDPPSDDLVYFN